MVVQAEVHSEKDDYKNEHHYSNHADKGLPF